VEDVADGVFTKVTGSYEVSKSFFRLILKKAPVFARLRDW